MKPSAGDNLGISLWYQPELAGCDFAPGFAFAKMERQGEKLKKKLKKNLKKQA